jgi:hypothetical protein
VGRRGNLRGPPLSPGVRDSICTRRSSNGPQDHRGVGSRWHLRWARVRPWERSITRRSSARTTTSARVTQISRIAPVSTDAERLSDWRPVGLHGPAGFCREAKAAVSVNPTRRCSSRWPGSSATTRPSRTAGSASGSHDGQPGASQAADSVASSASRARRSSSRRRGRAGRASAAERSCRPRRPVVVVLRLVKGVLASTVPVLGFPGRWPLPAQSVRPGRDAR